MYKMNEPACQSCQSKFCKVCGYAENSKEAEDKEKSQLAKTTVWRSYILVATAVALVALFYINTHYYGWNALNALLFFGACVSGIIGYVSIGSTKSWKLFTALSITISVLYNGYALLAFYFTSNSNKFMVIGVLLILAYSITSHTNSKKK